VNWPGWSERRRKISLGLQFRRSDGRFQRRNRDPETDIGLLKDLRSARQEIGITTILNWLPMPWFRAWQEEQRMFTVVNAEGCRCSAS